MHSDSLFYLAPAAAQALNRNPVVVYFSVWDDFWWYAGGIYASTGCSTAINHAVRGGTEWRGVAGAVQCSG